MEVTIARPESLPQYLQSSSVSLFIETIFIIVISIL